MAFAPGENVGPYRIIEQLGQGGMASVFKAYHPALDRYVAIKVLHPAFMDDPSFLSRFQREARVVAKLEHPHIVPIYDFAEHHSQPYLVMKFIEGMTLKARLAEGPLSKEGALRVVEAIGNALAYAHAQGVLHRDIKPSNVLLSPDGSIYLADFGLARIAQAGASTLSKDVLLGTPQYISPEQAKGTQELDEGTDIYSFGVVLYELVVGRVPFNADTPFSIIHDHIYTPLPLPRKVNPKVPEAVEQVLLKALAKERADRFKDVQALVKAFKGAVLGVDASVGKLSPQAATRKVPPDQAATKVLDEEEPVSVPEHAQPSVGRVEKRRRWPWVAGGVGMALICLFLFLLALGSAEVPGNAEAFDSGGVDRPVAQALGEAAEDPFVRLRKAKALSGEGKNLRAAQEFAAAGELFLREGAVVEAAEAFLRSLELGPAALLRQDDAAAGMQEALFLGASEAPVWGMVERVGELAPQFPHLDAMQARAFLHAGREEAALELLANALEEAPKDPFALAVMAESHLFRGDKTEALRIIEKELAKRVSLPPWLFEFFLSLEEKAQA